MNFELLNEIRTQVILACLGVAIFLPCYLILAIPFTLLGSTQKRHRRLKRMAKFGAAIAATSTGAWFLADYLWFAELRRTAHACETQVSENGEYVATQCLLNAGYNYLRVYDSTAKRLLADRTYDCGPGDTKLIVAREAVFDGCSHEDGWIDLPPSLLDRLQAALP